MTVKPDPPPQVEVGWAGTSSSTAAGSFQLFATQTLPAGSIDTSVTIWMLPLWKTWRTSPGVAPAERPVGSAPAISTAPRPQKLPTHTSSLPSTETPQGTLIALSPVKPIGAGWVPSGRIMFTTPVAFP